MKIKRAFSIVFAICLCIVNININVATGYADEETHWNFEEARQKANEELAAVKPEFYPLSISNKNLAKEYIENGVEFSGEDYHDSYQLFVYGTPHGDFDTTTQKHREIGYNRDGNEFPNPEYPDDAISSDGSASNWIKPNDLPNIYAITKWIGSGDSRKDYSYAVKEDYLVYENFTDLHHDLKRRGAPDYVPGNGARLNLMDYATIIQPPTSDSWGLAIFFNYSNSQGKYYYSTAFIKPYNLAAEQGDLCAMIRNPISSASPGDVVNLNFSISSTYKEDKDTEYTITRNGITERLNRPVMVTAEGEVSLPDSYSFTMSDRPEVVVLTVNGSGENPKESDLVNNQIILTINPTISAPGPPGDFELTYDELEKAINFTITSSASLRLPSVGYGTKWIQNTTKYSITITNETPDIYTDFKVKVGSITRRSDSVTFTESDFGDNNVTSKTINANISATIIRENVSDHITGKFDDPLSRIFAQNDVDITNFGKVTVRGSMSRDYEYKQHAYDVEYYSCSNPKHDGHSRRVECTHWVEATTSCSFTPIDSKKAVVIKVYNGMPVITKPVFITRIDNNTDSSLSKKIWWTSKPITMDVVRLMRTLTNSKFPVDGQYKRSFIEQNYADLEWKTKDIMQTVYAKDLDDARNRRYGERPKYAVFASDVAYNGSDYPIRSGTYFNPVGTYTFEIETEVYKDWVDSDPTPEHTAYVKALLGAFRYESNMVYNNENNPVTINGAPASKSGPAFSPTTSSAKITDYRGFSAYEDGFGGMPDPAYLPYFEIVATKDSFTKNYLELQHAYNESGTHASFKRVLEGYSKIDGYDKSNTRESKNAKKYVEFPHNDVEVYKITETTKVTIRVNPDNKNIYTHAALRNGNYSIKIYIANVALRDLKYVDFGGDADEHYLTWGPPRLTTPISSVKLDNISIKVIGSILDDAR